MAAAQHCNPLLFTAVFAAQLITYISAGRGAWSRADLTGIDALPAIAIPCSTGAPSDSSAWAAFAALRWLHRHARSRWGGGRSSPPAVHAAAPSCNAPSCKPRTLQAKVPEDVCMDQLHYKLQLLDYEEGWCRKRCVAARLAPHVWWGGARPGSWQPPSTHCAGAAQAPPDRSGDALSSRRQQTPLSSDYFIARDRAGQQFDTFASVVGAAEGAGQLRSSCGAAAAVPIPGPPLTAAPDSRPHPVPDTPCNRARPAPAPPHPALTLRSAAGGMAAGAGRPPRVAAHQGWQRQRSAGCPDGRGAAPGVQPTQLPARPPAPWFRSR